MAEPFRVETSEKGTSVIIPKHIQATVQAYAARNGLTYGKALACAIDLGVAGLKACSSTVKK